MIISRKHATIAGAFSLIVGLCYLGVHLASTSTEKVTKTTSLQLRPPGGDLRAERREAAESIARKPSSTQSDGHMSAAALEMQKAVQIPATIGQTGLWSGVAPSDAAIGGREAYAIARAGASKVDLKPDQNGTFQRLFAPKDETIEFQVRYPGLKPNQSVDIGILDGGTLDTAGPLIPDAQGRISFVFKTGPSDGSYRIALTTSDHDIKMIDIWAGRPEWEEPITTN